MTLKAHQIQKRDSEYLAMLFLADIENRKLQEHVIDVGCFNVVDMELFLSKTKVIK